MKLLIVCLFLAMICPISYAAMPDDLVLYMSFDSGTVGGGQVKDLSKYGNNGVIKGNPKSTNGKKGTR
ncbi:MAG: hypothetical protein ACPL7B_16465 [Candidatus Poribacteria bacterium]